MPPATRPAASRNSNFDWDVPSVIYSQSAADFRPPADYIGPRKSKLGKLPDPSMNPVNNGLPILSVSRLTVQNADGSSPSSKSHLPPVQGGTRSGKGRFSKENILTFDECKERKKILLKMPSTIQKQFRDEISGMRKKKKKHCTGNNKAFMEWDFHDPYPTPPPSLHGVLVLGGGHRDMVEEAVQEPGTPPPLSGRIHCVTQTEVYLENIMDDELDFKSAEMQCEPLFDDLVDDKAKEPVVLNSVKVETATISTQMDDRGQGEIQEAFEQVSTNIADVVIMESLRQLQEENELEALRKQHLIHKCLRNREVALLQKYKQAQAQFEDQKRTGDHRKPWDQNLGLVIAQVGFDKVQENAPSHFVRDEVDQAIQDYVQQKIVEPIKSKIPSSIDPILVGSKLLDDIIEEAALKREAEFAGKAYVKEPHIPMVSPNTPEVTSWSDDLSPESAARSASSGKIRKVNF